MKIFIPIAVILVAGMFIARSFVGGGSGADIPEQIFQYRCANCETIFTKSAAEVRQMIKEGRTAVEANTALKIECEKCKKIAAQVYEIDYYNPSN